MFRLEPHPIKASATLNGRTIFARLRRLPSDQCIVIAATLLVVVLNEFLGLSAAPVAQLAAKKCSANSAVPVGAKAGSFAAWATIHGAAISKTP
jgi:hypothetical protein